MLAFIQHIRDHYQKLKGIPSDGRRFSFATKWKMIHLFKKIIDDGIKMENSGLECVNVAQLSSPSKNTTFENILLVEVTTFLEFNIDREVEGNT